jgi:prophage DNA circulation protein
MPGRFNPLTALEGSFLGFPFKIAREHGEGGRRGPVHEYPDRDEPYFEDLGRKAKLFELNIYFIGPTADLTADLFDALLWKGNSGSLILPRQRRERMKAQKWSYDREAGKGNWVQFQVTFVEVGRNAFPTATDSWPHKLIDAALAARTAFADAMDSGLSLAGLPPEATAVLAGSAGTLVAVLNASALVASGQAPSTALAAASLLTGGYAASWAGPSIDTSAFALATFGLLTSWADALAGDTPTNDSRSRAIDSLLGVYDTAASPYWYAPGTQTPLEAAEISNQAALSAGIRRATLVEAARLAASLEFASYDDAAALRDRFADSFDEEIDRAAGESNVRGALVDLGSTTLTAISTAGADKAKLVSYRVAGPRPALALANFWYADDDDVPGRAAELRSRTGAIHPAFMPAEGERLSK